MKDFTDLKTRVYDANMDLWRSGLVFLTFGNVSGVCRQRGVVAIKPSGVAYERIAAEDMVLVDLDTGRRYAGDLNPSSDTPTHLELYRSFPACGGVVHTHSEYATACAQARAAVRCMGTTHADYFRGDIPVTRPLTEEEIRGDYERETGRVIAETFRSLDPASVSAVLVANHGPFAWGADPFAAVRTARVVEFLARVQCHAAFLAPDAPRPPAALVDRHYFRKHGPAAYYGQPGRQES